MTTISNTSTPPTSSAARIPRGRANKRRTDPTPIDARARRHNAELHLSSIVSKACDRFFRDRSLKFEGWNAYDGPTRAVSHAAQEAAQDVTSDAVGSCSGTSEEREHGQAGGNHGRDYQKWPPGRSLLAEKPARNAVPSAVIAYRTFQKP
jgi:hypothetical protein